MIIGLIELKSLVRYISYEYKCRFAGKKCNYRQE